MATPSKLAVQTLKNSRKSPLVPTLQSASSNGNTFENTGSEFLFIDSNRDSVAGNVTLSVPHREEVDGVHPVKQITVPYATEIIVGPFLTDVYNDDNENVKLTWSSVTNVSLAVVRVEG